MSRLVETIKLKDGRLYNLDYHSDRFNRSRKELYDIGLPIDLQTKIVVPAYANRGLYKCRIEYDEHIRSIEFMPYEVRLVKSLRLVESEGLEYGHKFIERETINKLFEKRMECDDVLLLKNGRITDTSYANVVLLGKDNKWYTPSTCILPGTKRAYLLDKGIITEKEITPPSMRRYRELRLINSMIDIGDTEGIPVKSICF